MGHKRLGELPNTQGWKRVKEMLAASNADTCAVAQVAFDAAQRFLTGLKSDPGLNYCFWLLSYSIWSAKKKDLYSALAQQGITLVESKKIESMLELIACLAEKTEEVVGRDPNSTVFSNIAQLAFRETLTKTIGREISLFKTTSEDIQAALARYATSQRVGLMAKIFFGTFLSRFIRYFIERELPNQIGQGLRFSNEDEVKLFESTLQAYCEQRARIIESYSGDWTSLRNLEGELTKEKVTTEFMPIALKKLKKELIKAEQSRGSE